METFQRTYLFIKKLLKDPAGLIGFLILCFMIFIAIFAPLIAPYDPTAVNMQERLQPPSGIHWFGTDNVGRDIFSRVIFGARITLTAGIMVVVMALSVGTLLGAIAGYFGGITNDIIMRITDIFLSFPSLVLAILIAATLGPGLYNAMVALLVSWWPWYTRLTQGQVLSVRQNYYVESAIAVGCSNPRVIFKHILPNCLSAIIVQATMDFGYAVLATASLSFIGLGVRPPTPEWGIMINEGRMYVLSGQWWMIFFPGIFLALTVLGFLLLGDRLNEVLNPRLEKR
ncbi:D,D-dipeptide ABC transporter permease [Candidatus Bathyarchaeota archaeon]|nr:MAG: D,D-dipeptide ABC transporter permease [Candidatus Bathyarchaeota archaeon]